VTVDTDANEAEENRMSFAPISFSPVWFSTDRQLAALVQVFQSATVTAKLLGRFDILADCASIQNVLMPWARAPLAPQAQGAITLNESSLAFRPTSFRIFGWRVRSPMKEIAFDLSPNDIIAIEPADFHSPVMRAFDLPFTRVRTSKSSPIDNFLLCVGGKIAIPRIRARSRELRGSLVSWHAVSNQGAMQ
jgi:hypothetical protein